ncbi:AAA family ATPase [Bacillus atrophaeus]|uniref:AAA family ATPase n=1 Tax=Bacillus atrophaeus TaxID=1452 RepID=UPI002280E9E7|nr:AAA family ATPase [Bacillus atrophaeus]MCY9162650.1 AAA family ATPase [Bacillus atrophaeus]
MIIWINGAFGSGKTQTSFELHRRLKQSYVYDPEKLGFSMRSMIPKEIAKEDFQSYSLWREYNYSMLKYVAAEYKGVIIVPMTIVNPEYFEDIIGKLRTDGLHIQHYTLMASKHVLQKRLRSRAEGKSSWAAKQIDRCREGLADQIFKEHIDTDHMSIEEATETIASKANLTLEPDTRGRFRKRADRLLVRLKHIRIC